MPQVGVWLPGTSYYRESNLIFILLWYSEYMEYYPYFGMVDVKCRKSRHFLPLHQRPLAKIHNNTSDHLRLNLLEVGQKRLGALIYSLAIF
jgi:hypothetical protein